MAEDEPTQLTVIRPANLKDLNDKSFAGVALIPQRLANQFDHEERGHDRHGALQLRHV